MEGKNKETAAESQPAQIDLSQVVKASSIQIPLNEMAKKIGDLVEKRSIQVIPNDPNDPRVRDGMIFAYDGSGMSVVEKRPYRAKTNRKILCFDDLVSFINWSGLFLPERSSIYFNEKGVFAVVDELFPVDGVVSFDLKKEPDLETWFPGGGFSRESLIEHLTIYGGMIGAFGGFDAGEFKPMDTTLRDIQLALLSIKFKEQIRYESVIDPNTDNVSLIFQKENGDPDSFEFPRLWKIESRVFKGGPLHTIMVRFHIAMPSETGGDPKFIFRWFAKAKDQDIAIEAIGQKIRDEVSPRACTRIYEGECPQIERPLQNETPF